MGDCGSEAALQAWFIREWAEHRHAGLFAKDLNCRSLLNAREGRPDGMCAIQDERDHPNLLSSKGFDGQQGMIDSAQSRSSNDDNRKSQCLIKLNTLSLCVMGTCTPPTPSTTMHSYRLDNRR